MNTPIYNLELKMKDSIPEESRQLFKAITWNSLLENLKPKDFSLSTVACVNTYNRLATIVENEGTITIQCPTSGSELIITY